MAAPGNPLTRQEVVHPLRNTSNSPLSLHDVGLFKSTILPSFTLHSGLSATSYVIARATDRLEIKDWLWPLAPVINAWWSSIGRALYYSDVSLKVAWESLSWSEKLLLGGVTTWGLRLFYRIASRSIARGKDDPRYEQDKKQPGFWNKAFFTQFLPEVLFQTAITLPFTVPFRVLDRPVSLNTDVLNVLRGIAVGLFSAGLALETLADSQVSSYRKLHDGLCHDGVWSIVRHPNYLGDTLVHLSFPLLCASGPFHPITVVGPLANYVFLRYMGGDKGTEEYQEKRYKTEDAPKYVELQEYRREKNSFWPSFSELKNPWTWKIVGFGLAGVAAEEIARALYTR
ncbi:hypothetical protein DTO166G4_3942 [Paecilomyces variotii]|nr:hypothetical protein DTO166G4_3942 [Paecilomyces variotii]KAJ9238222.1 hypothetical protein DTO166G5_3124 [Paecilomyces variotii]